nr:MAG TPA: Flavin-dependent thymidylate synthase [Caudoviricetes sp.]
MPKIEKVEILKHPTEADWEWCKTCTLNTIGKKSVNAPTAEWKRKLIASEHSPLRELWFGIRMTVPYWVSVHFVRHHIGANHYVQSQRNDRQDKYDRTTASQGEIVSHIMSINAQELIFMAHKRLCHQASPETMGVMEEICCQVIELNPEFEDYLEPLCSYRNGKCTEFYPCGYNKKFLKNT